MRNAKRQAPYGTASARRPRLGGLLRHAPVEHGGRGRRARGEPSRRGPRADRAGGCTARYGEALAVTVMVGEQRVVLASQTLYVYVVPVGNQIQSSW